MIYEILENNREGDHIVYISDLTKIKQLTEPKGDKGMLHTQFY